ncbi:cysteine hydrolase [Alteromonas pelagimontana]|uniref:Cysteine hydrolase n=1 Tax=Alteromonas pelagimontana TaxID=1858656 RepID=A0A6M4M8C2_9ALTE|nr:isochorismatase family cysteine hydrolase [Alteromonas pelagimontana]QJR79442.1 cysteine hydrolase [Alteromonas pelagimontana]
MTINCTDTAIIAVDFINEIIHPDGKMAAQGYSKFAQHHNTLDNVASLLTLGRKRGDLIIHVGLGFSEHYAEQPETSPLFGAAKENGILKLGHWGTRFHEKVAPLDEEVVLVKHRVSAFYSTTLELILRTNGVKKLLIAGCATDLAVQSTARDGHDRDFHCTIVEDCCAAGSEDDHQETLKLVKKVANISTLKELK